MRRNLLIDYRSTGSGGPDTPANAPVVAGRVVSVLALALSVSLVAGAAVAQIPLPEPAQVKLQPRGEGRYQGLYSESTSRALFQACDGNSDDRLDVFETADAFDILPSPRDLDGFARFDTDRDGFVTWPEFDQRFQKGLEYGGLFLVRTVRPFVLPEAPPQPLTPLQKFLRLYDRDGDGGLSPTELVELLKALGLPLEAAGLLMQSDLNKSGRVEEVELAPWFDRLPKLPQPDKGSTAAGLRQPWLDADGNQDQNIDAAELTMLLRRLDPGLLRWTKALLDKLDSNKDGKLSATELQQLKPSNPVAPTSKPGTKPVQAPQR